MTQSVSLVKQKPRYQWTNLDWANYLQCPIREVPSLRSYISESYLPAVCKHVATGKYHFCVYRLHVAPSGWRDWHLWLSDDKNGFTNAQDAICYANEIAIPQLQFNDIFARFAGVPTRALQLMHIKER